MTTLEHFNDSARAMARGAWLNAQSAESYERGMRAIEATEELLHRIGAPELMRRENSQ